MKLGIIFFLLLNILYFINFVSADCIQQETNRSISNECSFCKDLSKEGYEIGKCQQNNIAYEKCPIGNRCIEDIECQAICEIVTREPCFFEEIDSNEKIKLKEIYDGCLFCDRKSNSIKRCRGHYEEIVQTCNISTACINIDCDDVRCENRDLFYSYSFNECDQSVFYLLKDHCLTRCPENTSINTDISFRHCISDRSCIEQNGTLYKEKIQVTSTLYKIDPYCGILKIDETFPGEVRTFTNTGVAKCGKKLNGETESFAAPSFLWFSNEFPYGDDLCNKKRCVQVDYLDRSITIAVKDKCTYCSKNTMILSTAAFNDLKQSETYLISDKMFNFTFVPCKRCNESTNSVISCHQDEAILNKCDDTNEICVESNECSAKCEQLDLFMCLNSYKNHRCLGSCPKNTAIKIDTNNETCIAKWKCKKLGGILLNYERYCKLPEEILFWQKHIGLIAATVGILFVLFIIFMIIYVWQIKKKYVPKDVDLPLEHYGDLADNTNSSGLTIISKKFIKKLDEKLGEGTFGVVYKGELLLENEPKQNTQRYYIAIKELKDYLFLMHHANNSDVSDIIQSQLEEMMEEAKIMSKLEHPNVLPLYGICVADQTIKIITPYRRLGSLNNFLKTNYEKISGKLQLQLCQQIASALAYLSAKHIVHGDLATRNILIASDTNFHNNSRENFFEFSQFTAQVSDFGLAQMLGKNMPKNKDVLPFRWAAIECLKEHMGSYKNSIFCFNEKTDVWSFGVTIWEILTFGRIPYEDFFQSFVNSTIEATYSDVSAEINRIINTPTSDTNSGNCSNSNSSSDPIADELLKLLLDFLLNGARLVRPLNCTDDLYIIMLECWSENPVQRRPFVYLEQKFHEAIQNPGDYIVPVDPSYLFAYNPVNRAKNIGLDPVNTLYKNKLYSERKSLTKGIFP